MNNLSIVVPIKIKNNKQTINYHIMNLINTPNIFKNENPIKDLDNIYQKICDNIDKCYIKYNTF